jgi:hypothetical protein
MDSRSTPARVSPPFNAPVSIASRKRKASHNKDPATAQKGDLQPAIASPNLQKRPKLSEANGTASVLKSSVQGALPAPGMNTDVEMADTPKVKRRRSLFAPQNRQRETAMAQAGSSQHLINSCAPKQSDTNAARALSMTPNAPLQVKEDDDEDGSSPTVSDKVRRAISSAALATGSTTAGVIHHTEGTTEPGPQVSIADTQDCIVPAPVVRPLFPAINAGNHFKVPLTAVHQPWPFDFPQARLAYSQTTGCPIDWSVFPSIPLSQTQVYELRRPWSQNPAPWDKVRVDLAQLEGKKTLSAEGVRKRFAKVNKTVFETTGVYFLLNGHGLQQAHGVPNDSDMPGILKGAGNVKPGKSAKASEACKYVALTQDRVTEDDISTVALQQPGQSFRAIRHIPKKIMVTLNITNGQTLLYTATTFDRWYTCICFGPRQSLPKRIYKLKQLPDRSYTHADEGMPPVTVQTLLDTYCLSQLVGTTEVSDMLLDEVMRSLNTEKALNVKYGAGSVCEGDRNDVVRLLDLQSDDLEKLWKNTMVNDPIRKLLLDLFLHELDTGKFYDEEYEEVRQDALHFPHCIRHLWGIFAEKRRKMAIESFVKEQNPQRICAKYHNHHGDRSCYQLSPASALSKQMIDDTVEEPNMHLLEIKGVAWYRIENKTGNHLDLDALQIEKQGWEWERICSVNSWIFIKPEGPQYRKLHPVYFGFAEMDHLGRFPSHPGYQEKRRTPGSDKYDNDEE